MTQDTHDMGRSKLVILKGVAEFGEECHYHLNGDNLRNIEVILRETAIDFVKAQKEVLSPKVYKNWRRQAKERYSLDE